MAIFGTTAISSEGTNASGEGKFEYDVPSGYTALCTKGVNLIMAYTTISKSTDYFDTKLYTQDQVVVTMSNTGVGLRPWIM